VRVRLAEVGAVTALATIVTLLLALPVLRAPAERVFGAEIVGRHYDPFTMMQQFERPLGVGLQAQPLTDLPGALIARVSGGVAAYNWLVLLTFPLAAAAAYLLARHLALSVAAATVVAMAYAFSPFHLAHAAYHPHIAQVQWVPLYLLALWRCLDAATPGAVVALGAAAVAVTLSNFYGGFIAAVITPVAVGAYWASTRGTAAHPVRRLAVTAATLLLIASAGLAAAWAIGSAALPDRTGLAFPRADLFRYSARWWSYLVPPVDHPLLGPAADRVWTAAGVSEGLLEQQVSLGWGLIALALVALSWWFVRSRPVAPLARVPILVIVAIVALVCSLAPERTIGSFTIAAPSAFLYDLVPMFRSYARFGVVVQLMAALLAGIGVDCLWRSGSRRARIAGVALVVIAATEYAAAPATLWRDVLPTSAHRWVMQQAEPMRVLDCVPLTQESASVQWLTGSRVGAQDGLTGDCTEPNLAHKLAAHEYSHVLVRRNTAAGRLLVGAPLPDGLRVAASFTDSRVYAVAAPRPVIYTRTMTGFSPRERDRDWSWRWMGPDGAWIIANTARRPIAATLHLEVSSFHHNRHVTLLLNRKPVQTIVVEPERRTYLIGPLTVPPGAHELGFRPIEAPTVADDVIHNRDRRPLSVAIGSWTWSVDGERR
jgi:hypothetical protein